MFRKFLVAVAMLAATGSYAAVDVNKGTAADLDGLKGVGPSMSRHIIEVREQGAFKNWPDFMTRVKGIKEKKAAKLSAEGMTVNGQAFDGAAVARTPVAKNRAVTTEATMSKAK